jgi:hypothetical protein
MDQTSGKSKIAIVGSCVTRDAFTHVPQLGQWCSLGPYVSRATILSMCAQPVDHAPEDCAEAAGISGFNDRRFLQDLRKSYWPILRQAAPDVVLVDLIDERHTTYAMGPSALTITKSSLPFLERTALQTGGGRRIVPLTEEWMRLTLGTIDAFAERLRASVPSECRIVVHWASYATCYIEAEAKGRRIPFEDRITTAAARWNTFLEEAYTRLSIALGASDLRLPDEEIVAGGDHLWDLNAFHYDASYYRKFSAVLESLIGTQCPRESKTT